MTPENQKIREALKAAENIIVSALAHQPEDDEKCREHLLRAAKDVQHKLDIIEIIDSCYKGVENALNNLTSEKTEASLDDKEPADMVACWKCGELIDLENAERFFSSGGFAAYICKHCAAEEAF